jgi:integrase
MKAKITSNETVKQSRWQKTPAANIVRYVPTGKLYARVRIRGKLIVRRLKTKSMAVAQSRLNELANRERRLAASREALADGRMVFGQALSIFRQRLDYEKTLKERSKDYRNERINALLKSWPNLEQTDVRKISKADCLNWAGRFGKKASPTAFNNTIATLRMIVDIAVEAGARFDNPAGCIKRAKVRPKDLQLPSQGEFIALVNWIRNCGTRYGKDSADFVQFLAFSGCRKTEGTMVTWADWKGEELVIRETKNGETRRVPIIPELKEVLNSLRTDRKDEAATTPIVRVKECQGALTRACKQLSISRITHHDLRHLFATRCIETGVDIPTVSKWLGHKDGGALAMKTYGHLRNEHSIKMAQLVRFAETPANVVQLPKTEERQDYAADEKQVKRESNAIV